MTTTDGYILRVFRLLNPHITRDQEKSNPIVLWHGVAVTSDSWLFSTVGSIDRRGLYSENNVVYNDCKINVTSNLAYTLSACGYDVWLPNTRGTHYSLGHQTLNANRGSFINFKIAHCDRKIYFYSLRFKVLGIHSDRTGHL